MMTLAGLQRAFLAAVTGGDPASAEQLVRPAAVGAARRLDIYRNNARSNWRGAMQAVYPVVLALVGEPFFNEAADRLADAEPSRSGDLHRFGSGFADFLTTYPYARELPYLPDVARLEWAWHESFHAAEHEKLAFEQLAQVAPGRYGELRFRLHPSARLVRSDYPVFSIWQANQPGVADVAGVELDSGGERVLVFRGDLDTRLFPLEENDWAFLASLARGDSLEDAASVEQLAARPDFLGPALSRWAEEGLIVSFSLPEGDET
jgi:hypothetical protein